MFFILCIYFFLHREMAMHEMEIPHEVLLSIERILDLQENVEGNDELASLSADFSPVGVLNTPVSPTVRITLVFADANSS